MALFPFAGRPDGRKSAILRVCEAESCRQWRSLIMIPSESICHPEAAAIVARELGSIYAEGLPQPLLMHDPREAAEDEARFSSWQRRLSDRRFYKGTINANRAELIAHKCIAEVFAMLAGSPPVSAIHVNVQALSGTAANLAAYEALLKPGDRLMGLALGHGGHLTHGSEFNYSGKTYRVHSYEVDERTRQLDYAQIRDLARQWKPRLIIGGASAYPWDFDWVALRSIADEVGAYVLADIAHLAGLVAAGVASNPLPHAHVVTFTTHKTLCGPRGAVIMTTDPALARQFDTAVFPGLQGGPHMNSIAAIARLFELIIEDRKGFCRLQRDIVDNAQFFAHCLAKEGFALEYGGTNTHMLLVNLRKFPVAGEVALDGEIASRLLEIAGIVCNKNMILGDADAAHASGLRFGLPWLTQRGVTQEQLREIARITKSVLASVRTLAVWSPVGEQKCRGRVPPGVLAEAAERTRAIARALPYPPCPEQRTEPTQPAPIGDRVGFLLRGDKTRLALGQLLTARLPVDGRPVMAAMLAADGTVIDHVIAVEIPSVGREQRWLLFPHEDRAGAVRHWIEDLSDGYLLFDEADVQQKIDGPIVVEELSAGALPESSIASVGEFRGEPMTDLTKPYFIGQRALYAKANVPPKEPYFYESHETPLRRTVLYDVHRELGAKMAPFAGWEMPIHYAEGILAEHRAVRTAAGLFDVSHMSALAVNGRHAETFLEALLTGRVSRLDPGEAQYSIMLSPDGKAIDDLYVYRLERDRFMLVVNAANADHVRDWISAVNARRVMIDPSMPGKELDGAIELRDLRDAGDDSRIDLAFQGPASLRVLEKISRSSADRAALRCLLPNRHVAVTLGGVPALVARTGYTGEQVGFEVFVHPNTAEEVWRLILEAGRPWGVRPAALGTRDSARIEAGLPLFGHSLEGELSISMTEAGYGFVPLFNAPFFVGREAYMARVRCSQRHMLRLRGQGRKTLRPGHVVLDASGRPVGQVTDFAYVHPDMTFFVLACVGPDFRPEPGQAIRGARVPAGKLSGPVEERSIVELTVLTRFPEDEERQTWPERYA